MNEATSAAFSMNHVGVWFISLLSILAVLFRPFKLSEWVWAITGSMLLLIFRLISLSTALHAVNEGVDVYFFLVGMMLLSEQARNEGLFNWIAEWASVHAQGSSRRLFVLIYAAGILVTMFLSNDATAVVMTPAVYAAVKKAGAKPLPYLFACAFIANAASFLLPISNPANLVVFASRLPSIVNWLKHFALPSFAAIAATYFVLSLYFRKDLNVSLSKKEFSQSPALSSYGKLTAYGLLGVIFVMLGASSLEWKLGLPTFIASAIIVFVVALKKREWPKQVVKEIAWGVIPLVAGLFVIVEAVNQAGALEFVKNLLRSLSAYSDGVAKMMAAFAVGVASNLANNLPVGLVSGMAVQGNEISEKIRNAVLIGVDLGPNLSVTGSLATILWLMALRREGEPVSGFAFFKVGLIAMPLALALSILALS